MRRPSSRHGPTCDPAAATAVHVTRRFSGGGGVVYYYYHMYIVQFLYSLSFCATFFSKKKKIYICIYQYVFTAGTGPLTRIDLLLLNDISFYETDNRSEKNVHNRGSYCTTRDTLQCWDLTDTYCTILYIIITQYNIIPL